MDILGKGLYIKQADGSFQKFMHCIESENEYSQLSKVFTSQKKISIPFFYFDGISEKGKNVLNLTFPVKNSSATIILYGTVFENGITQIEVKYGDGQVIKSKKLKL